MRLNDVAQRRDSI